MVELPALAAVKVTVIPKSLTIQTAARVGAFYDCAVDIGVQQKLKSDDLRELDVLMRLVEELGDHHLEQHRQFTSVLTVTYRVCR